MPILQLPMQVPGLVGVLPNQKFMVTTDSLSAITTAGYLNQVNLQSNPVSNTDILQVVYSFNPQTTLGTYGVFTVSISNGVITLTIWANPGDVVLPVTSGHFANFSGTLGKIADLGYLPSNAAKTVVAMQTAGTTVLNRFLASTDTAGTIGNITKANGTEASNLVTASGLAGLITTSSLTTAAGAAYEITWTNTFALTTSTVLITCNGGSNGTVPFDLAITAVPGNGVITLVLTNNSADPLDGTIILGYAIL